MKNLYSGNIVKTESGRTFQIKSSTSVGYLALEVDAQHKVIATENTYVLYSKIVKVIPTCHECGHPIDENIPHPTFGNKHFCDTRCEAEYAL